MKVLFLAACLSLSTPTLAHDGHGDLPGSVAAPHGGKVLVLTDLYLEVVKTGTTLKVYPLTHDLKTIATSEVKLTAKIDLPKQKEPTPAAISTGGDAWTIEVDAKNARRFTVLFNVGFKGENGNTKYTVER